MKKMIQSGLLLTVRHALAWRGQFSPARLLALPVCWTALCGLLLCNGALAQPAASAEADSRQEANDRVNALALAQQSLDQGDYDKAIELATLVLQGWPGDTAAKELLARAHMRKAMGSVAPSPQSAQAATDTPAPTQPDPGAAPPLATTDPLLLPEVAPPKATKHEISVSGDFFLGEGTITLPFGYSIQASLGGTGIEPSVGEADRSSDYYGATLSYSFGQAWYFDLSYAAGSSSGNPIIIGLPSTFELEDTWYQAYVRYTFPGLRGRRLSAYLRAGVSLVESELTWTTTLPQLGFYTQDNEAQDLLGNLGFGVRYTIYANRQLSIGLQAEGEGFYGTRTQDSNETLTEDFGLEPVTVSLDNTLMGGIGRGTVRFEYRLGSSGLLRVYLDAGFQAKFTIVDYPDGGGSENELLWGPYAKLGVRYSF
jgi:hypothetical protein